MTNKRICVLLLILTITGVATHAQIQRSFFGGIELGRSTKNEVISFLNNSGWDYDTNMGGFDAIGVNENVGLGGYMWSPSFSFYNSILSDLLLVIPNIGIDRNGHYSDESGNNTFIFYNLKQRLKEKYSSAENIVNPQNPTHMLILRDNQTLIMLELTDEKVIRLTYSDRKLLRMMRSGSDL